MELRHIQWYPGHMHKASKDLLESYKKVDVFIELLDARIPYSSSNPLLEQIRREKPCVKVLSKSDLADSNCNLIWQKYFESQNWAVQLIDSRNRGQISNIPGKCHRVFRNNGGTRKHITAMVMGIPNVGKSTLINGLAGRAVAKTGNEPAVTKQQQFVQIGEGFRLLDTPGLMWPKIENLQSGYRLAVTGAIRDTALTHTDVALFAIQFLVEQYRVQFIERYKLDDAGADSLLMLEQIGRKRGCLVKGGNVDFDRAAKIVISDIREGRLGRLTWESPEGIEKEMNKGQPQPQPELTAEN